LPLQLSPHLQREFTYDSRNLLTSQSILKDAAPLFETRYDYDRSGNLTRRSDSAQGVDEYRYDAIGRLLQHIDPKGKVERYFNDPAGDRLRTEVKRVQARKVVGGDDDGLTTWTREGTYQGVHYVFDRAGDLVRKGAPHGDAPDDLTLIWDANHRLAESRRNGQSTYYGYDPLGRRVFKRNPTQTTWFFWDGDALLGEVQQANDAEEAAPVWVGNVGSLVEMRRRQRRLERLHERVREYVYYPGTFVPLALFSQCGHDVTGLMSIGPHSAVGGESSDSAPPRLSPPAVVEGPVIQTSRSVQPVSELRIGGLSGGALGAVVLGGSAARSPRSAQLPLHPGSEQSVETGSAARTAGSGQHAGWSQLYFYHNEPNGAPTRITDRYGMVLWAARYNASGGVEATEPGPLCNPLRLQGQYFDEETGLHYNRFRYFDATSASYTSRDPLGTIPGVNLHAFGPNTTSWIDPLGLTALDHTGADGQGYTIYALVDRKSGQVKYVGLTEHSRYFERMNEHQTSGRLHGALESIELDAAANYAEARGKEQFYIDTHGTIETSQRGQPFGPGAEGNRQVGFDINRTDDRGKAFRAYYDTLSADSPGSSVNLPACRG